MKITIGVICVAFLMISCGHTISLNKYLTYQNIVILSDMSSRLENRPPKDIEEIRKIEQFFKNECVKPGEKIGDKSSLTFTTFSEKVISSIDINKIKSLEEKQQFINSTGRYVSTGLSFQLSEFDRKVIETYSEPHNPGLDLISLLIDKIQNDPIVKKDIYLTDGLDTTFIHYENHIYIFTDGYLEYQNKDLNNEYYFGSNEIERVRQFCKEQSVSVEKALERDSSLCLRPYLTSLNKYVNLHILETHERDKNIKLLTYKHASGFRDNEILESVWRKWAMESGFKSLEWKKY